MEEGSLDLAEIHRGHFPQDVYCSIFDIYDFWGLYQDYETQARVSEVLKEDLERTIAERSGGEVLAVRFYPSYYFFTKKPLRTGADVQGLRIRIPSPVSNVLLNGMGAIVSPVVMGEVLMALENDELDAAISCSSCGAALSWYEKTGYLVGPIPALGRSWVTVSSRKWSQLSADIQLIIREEAKRHEMATKEASLARWDQVGVQRNVAEGMQHIELTPELKDLMHTAVLTWVLPNWVDRAAGYAHVIELFNQKVAPIVGVEIGEEVQAKDIW